MNQFREHPCPLHARLGRAVPNQVSHHTWCYRNNRTMNSMRFNANLSINLQNSQVRAT